MKDQVTTYAPAPALIWARLREALDDNRILHPAVGACGADPRGRRRGLHGTVGQHGRDERIQLARSLFPARRPMAMAQERRTARRPSFAVELVPMENGRGQSRFASNRTYGQLSMHCLRSRGLYRGFPPRMTGSVSINWSDFTIACVAVLYFLK